MYEDDGDGATLGFGSDGGIGISGDYSGIGRSQQFASFQLEEGESCSGSVWPEPDDGILPTRSRKPIGPHFPIGIEHDLKLLEGDARLIEGHRRSVG